jgi:hypothetical protein
MTVASWSAVALTQSDTATFRTTRGVYVGTAGSLVVTMNDGVDVTFTGCLGGMVYPFQIVAFKTASTASNVVALY